MMDLNVVKNLLAKITRQQLHYFYLVGLHGSARAVERNRGIPHERVSDHVRKFQNAFPPDANLFDENNRDIFSNRSLSNLGRNVWIAVKRIIEGEEELQKTLLREHILWAHRNCQQLVLENYNGAPFQPVIPGDDFRVMDGCFFAHCRHCESTFGVNTRPAVTLSWEGKDYCSSDYDFDAKWAGFCGLYFRYQGFEYMELPNYLAGNAWGDQLEHHDESCLNYEPEIFSDPDYIRMSNLILQGADLHDFIRDHVTSKEEIPMAMERMFKKAEEKVARLKAKKALSPGN